MRVVNKHRERHTVYIGRGSIYGNPYYITFKRSREEAIELYEMYARGKPELLEAIKRLPEDAVLGCFCAPFPCHGDVIIKLWHELNGD